jgi:hypothetical protein
VFRVEVRSPLKFEGNVSNLFNTPGMQLEIAGAAGLAFGVICYLARVAWLSLARARRIERESTQSLELPFQKVQHQEPYCAG